MPTHRLLLIPCISLLLGGCVVAPYPYRGVYQQPVPAYDPGYGAGAPVVGVAPPPPLVEVIPAIPFAGAIWIGGNWGWHGGRHHWNPGRWEHPRHGGRWQERRGGWQGR